jgi:NADH-quinone oxidoreductase subunit G
MPCLAKKVEALYPCFDDAKAGSGHDIDCVLTTRELDRMLKRFSVRIDTLEEQPFDRPFGKASGAGEIFGATGGVMEAALRSAYYYVTGSNPAPNAFTEVRGVDAQGKSKASDFGGSGQRRNASAGLSWKEASYQVGDLSVKVAIASGLQNAANLLEALKRGDKQYDFVEIMACPGGCVGGGGQPIKDGREQSFERGEILYGLDQRNEVRFSHENPDIKKTYAEFFDKPLSPKAEQLLHTDQHSWQMPGERAR